MKEGRDLVMEAIQDAKSLKEAAVESAKKQLVEELAPAIRQLLDEKIGGIRTIGGKVAAGEQRAQSRNPANPDEEARKEESVNLTLEDALQEFFPKGSNKESKKMFKSSKKSSKKSSVKEGSEVTEAKSSKKSSGMCEEIEISEAELKKVYEAALQAEVTVKKGFSDLVGGGEIEQAHKETGILDKDGTKMFNDKEPPHKQSWIPEAKELQGMVQKGLAENKALRENLRKAVAMVETLGKKLHEVNLFNAKVLHVNKILNSGARLTKEQKTFVMESIDKARTISEVKMVFETIVGSIKTAAAINENRNTRPPKANAQGMRTSGTPKQDVLSESVDRANNQSKFSRVQELAGLVK
jgi:hypothetical protein